MGHAEIDPETGEYVIIPDPNMDWTGQDGPPMPDGLNPTGFFPDTEDGKPSIMDRLDLTGILPDTDGGTLPGLDPGGLNPGDWDTESAPKPWLTDPDWKPESDPDWPGTSTSSDTSTAASGIDFGPGAITETETGQEYPAFD